MRPPSTPRHRRLRHSNVRFPASCASRPPHPIHSLPCYPPHVRPALSTTAEDIRREELPEGVTGTETANWLCGDFARAYADALTERHKVGQRWASRLAPRFRSSPTLTPTGPLPQPATPDRPFEPLYKGRELLTALLATLRKRLGCQEAEAHTLPASPPPDVTAAEFACKSFFLAYPPLFPFASLFLAHSFSPTPTPPRVFQPPQPPSPSVLQITYARLLFFIAETHTESEEFSVGEKLLARVIEILSPHALQPQCCGLFLQALNANGFVWSRLQDHERASAPLQRAEAAYKAYLEHHAAPAGDGAAPLPQEGGPSPAAAPAPADGKAAMAAATAADAARTGESMADASVPALDVYSAKGSLPPARAPWAPHELLPAFGAELRFKAFDAAFTSTSFYLAQCMPLLGRDEAGALYCLRTLSRQHMAGESNNMDWVVNCAAMSQFYLSYYAFENARYCLACATAMEATLPKDSITEADANAGADTAEVLRAHEVANIGRCWIRYYISLLSAGSDLNSGQLTAEAVAEARQRVAIRLSFSPEGVSEAEAGIPTAIPRNFEDARSIFKLAQAWLTRCLETLQLDGYTTEHVAAVQERSRLYLLLATFEPDPDRACKMHKRRIDMLEPLATSLNPQYYLAICKQLHYELGETYMRMMELKMDILKALQPSGQGKPSHIEKINRLCVGGGRKGVQCGCGCRLV